MTNSCSFYGIIQMICHCLFLECFFQLPSCVYRSNYPDGSPSKCYCVSLKIRPSLKIGDDMFSAHAPNISPTTHTHRLTSGHFFRHQRGTRTGGRVTCRCCGHEVRWGRWSCPTHPTLAYIRVPTASSFMP